MGPCLWICRAEGKPYSSMYKLYPDLWLAFEPPIQETGFKNPNYSWKSWSEILDGTWEDNA